MREAQSGHSDTIRRVAAEIKIDRSREALNTGHDGASERRARTSVLTLTRATLHKAFKALIHCLT